MPNNIKLHGNLCTELGPPVSTADWISLGLQVFLHVQMRVVRSSQLLLKIAAFLVSIVPLILCLGFLYTWRFLNKISLDWLLTLTTQSSTSKLSDNPAFTQPHFADLKSSLLAFSLQGILLAKASKNQRKLYVSPSKAQGNASKF